MEMTSSAVLNDFEPATTGPGIIVDNSGISIANLDRRDDDVIKCGFLWKRTTGISTARVSSRAKYFVLTKAALEYYRNDKCVSVKILSI